MENKKKGSPNEKDQKVDLEYLLRTNGYLFPETVNEVSEYERRFGDTDIILPDEMQEPTFLEKALAKLPNNNLKAILPEKDNFAVAARSQKGSHLPEHIKKKMEDDRAKNKDE
jgi:hypothetical protein